MGVPVRCEVGVEDDERGTELVRPPVLGRRVGVGAEWAGGVDAAAAPAISNWKPCTAILLPINSLLSSTSSSVVARIRKTSRATSYLTALPPILIALRNVGAAPTHTHRNAHNTQHTSNTHTHTHTHNNTHSNTHT